MTTTTDLMFDHDITLGVVGHLSRLFDGFGATPVAEEYEPGMWQVRLDPTDTGAVNGWIAVAGTTPNGLPGWVLVPTVRSEDPESDPEATYFVTADDNEYPSRYPLLTDLGLMLNAPIDTVADVIYVTTFASLNNMVGDDPLAIAGR